jgi:surfeit locus 1 family protein
VAHPLLRPRWVVLHVIIAIAVPLFVIAGFWQLRRLDERRAINRSITERADERVRPLADVLAAGDPDHRPVHVAGTYDTDEEVVLIGRPGPDGIEGSHVLTPLITDDGTVLVDRGWVPPGMEDPPLREAAPADDDVTAVGILLRTEGNPRLASGEGEHGGIVDRVDVARLASGADDRFVTTAYYVLLRSQEPPPAELPRPVEPRRPGEGPHLGYAVQWFLFVPTLLVVYVLLLRQQVRRARGVER